MQIQLCEDDGVFHGGVPQIVILLVKFDDGKTKRIPYPADKSISALYQDLQAIAPQISESPLDTADTAIEKVLFTELEGLTGKTVLSDKPKESPKAVVDKSNIIVKEDIVTLVKLHERDTTFSGMIANLVVGMDYRVIEVFGPFHPVTQKRLPQSYDIIDDHAPTPERMRVFPDEIVLKNKRISQVIPQVSAIEEILPCPSCQAKNTCVLDGDEFKGTCIACSQDIVIARIIKKCGTSKCGKEVSCFDVGGKYEGVCGNCHSRIEVPYAA